MNYSAAAASRNVATILPWQFNCNCLVRYQPSTADLTKGTAVGDMIRNTVPTSYIAPISPRTALIIQDATPQTGGNLLVAYISGGGQEVKSPRLRWMVVGVDADFARDVAVNLAGQTLTGFTAADRHLFVRAGNTDGPEVPVTTIV